MLAQMKCDRIYIACRSIDMRKSISGLAVIVNQCFELDPFEDALFVFCNRWKDKIKILRWDKNGFWLYYKRLEKGHFRWPQIRNGNAVNITQHQLNCLLSGLSLEEALIGKQAPEVLQRKLI
jgi:transposase